MVGGVNFLPLAQKQLKEMSLARAVQKGEHLWVGLGEPSQKRVEKILRATYQYTAFELRFERDGNLGRGVHPARIGRFLDELKREELLGQVVVFGHNHPFAMEQTYHGLSGSRIAAMENSP